MKSIPSPFANVHISISIYANISYMFSRNNSHKIASEHCNNECRLALYLLITDSSFVLASLRSGCIIVLLRSFCCFSHDLHFLSLFISLFNWQLIYPFWSHSNLVVIHVFTVILSNHFLVLVVLDILWYCYAGHLDHRMTTGNHLDRVVMNSASELWVMGSNIIAVLVYR